MKPQIHILLINLLTLQTTLKNEKFREIKFFYLFYVKLTTLPYGAPRQIWVAKAGTNIAQRLVKFLLAMEDSGPKNLAKKPFFSVSCDAGADFTVELKLRHLEFNWINDDDKGLTVGDSTILEIMVVYLRLCQSWNPVFYLVFALNSKDIKSLHNSRPNVLFDFQ